MFFIVVVSIKTSPTVQEGSLFSISSPAFIVCRFFDDGHSDWGGVRPHCNFDLHLPNNQQCGLPFHVHIGHLYIFFEEMSIQVLSIFKKLWLFGGFVIELWEVFVYFENQALVGCIICKYYIPVCRLSFCFVYGFFCCAKACKFDQVPCVFLYFYCLGRVI